MTGPAVLLRAESVVLLAGAVALYARNGTSWWLFLAVILAPDLAALGYLAGSAAGTAAYNLAHCAALPGLVALVGLGLERPTLLAVALIWFAHIAGDRAIGYGLKYAGAAKGSHLQRV